MIGSLKNDGTALLKDFVYNNIKLISHTYDNSFVKFNKRPIVCIKGDVYGFCNYVEEKDKYGNIISTIVGGWRGLIEIIQWGICGLRVLQNGFAHANKLYKLPEGIFSIGTINADYCFNWCTSLKTFPHGFSLSNNLKHIEGMFNGCGFINLSRYTLTIPNSVIKCGALFSDCRSLKELPKHLFDKLNPSATSLQHFCLNCFSLRKIDNTFKIPNFVTNLYGMFQECHMLTTLPNNFNIPIHANYLNKMFQGCIALENIANIKLPNTVLNISYMFDSCFKLLRLPSNFWPADGFFAANEININYMFRNCYFLTGVMPPEYFWLSYTDWEYIDEDEYINSEDKVTEPEYTLAFLNCFTLENYSKIPISWGGLYDITNKKYYDEAVLQFEFLNDNTTISIPIHQTYKTFNRTTGVFVDLPAGYNFKINWGDRKCRNNNSLSWV